MNGKNIFASEYINYNDENKLNKKTTCKIFFETIIKSSWMVETKPSSKINPNRNE
jgi:hypothetical protein